MNINQRVEQLIQKIAQNKAGFSVATGISTVILSHIGSGRNKVSLSAVEQILIAYPQVSPEWLILGKGNMFKEMKDTRELDRIKSEVLALKAQLQINSQSTERKIEHITNLLDSLNL
mgnify:CR=1 FL=1|jgi:hypothetical protein